MKEYNGFVWPDSDEHCQKAVFGELPKLHKIIEQYVGGRSICIQAGGNVGVFPKELAKYFDAVYTFEPDPENFECLVWNVPEPNVVKFMAGLGSHSEFIKVGVTHEKEKHNCGAYQVIADGIIPIMRIDDFQFPLCDLIYLDIEGYELFALQGAYETIEKHSPVIVIENKILTEMYDVEPEQVVDFIVNEFGYTVKERIMRDVVLVKE